MRSFSYGDCEALDIKSEQRNGKNFCSRCACTEMIGALNNRQQLLHLQRGFQQQNFVVSLNGRWSKSFMMLISLGTLWEVDFIFIGDTFLIYCSFRSCTKKCLGVQVLCENDAPTVFWKNGKIT